MTLNEIFKNTTYDGTLFSEESKAYVESKISQKTVRGSEGAVGRRKRTTAETCTGVGRTDK